MGWGFAEVESDKLFAQGLSLPRHTELQYGQLKTRVTTWLLGKLTVLNGLIKATNWIPSDWMSNSLFQLKVPWIKLTLQALLKSCPTNPPVNHLSYSCNASTPGEKITDIATEGNVNLIMTLWLVHYQLPQDGNDARWHINRPALSKRDKRFRYAQILPSSSLSKKSINARDKSDNLAVSVNLNQHMLSPNTINVETVYQ